MLNTSWPKLFFIAGSLGCGISILSFLHLSRRRKFIESAKFMKTAQETIEKSSFVSNLLGQPIQFKDIDIHDGWTDITPPNMKIMVQMFGPKDQAQAYLYTQREDDQGDLDLCKLEIVFAKHPGRILTLMNSCRIEDSDAGSSIKKDDKKDQ